MGVYSFTLPHTPPARLGRGVAEALGLPALKMFRDGPFRTLILCALLMAGVQQFFALYGHQFLIALDAPNPTALQTLSQVSEVVCLMAFPLVLARYGFKVTLAVGILGWIVRNLLFATGWLPAIVAVGLPLHGMCFSFFFLVSNVYVDRHAPPHLRASAQGVLTFVVAGLGTLSGNWVSAEVLESVAHRWDWFWLVPAVAAAVVLGYFLAYFRDDTAVRRDMTAEAALTSAAA
jgi:MFS family permease